MTIERLIQKYLAAERVYLSKPVSGTAAHDVERTIMKIYCSRNRRKDSYGVIRDGPPLSSSGAVVVLLECLKFGAKDVKYVGHSVRMRVEFYFRA